MTTSNQSPVSAEPAWRPARPKFRPLALIVAWILSAAALLVAAWIVPGAHVENFWGALVARAVIAILNALLPPLIAALRLPLMLVIGLLLVLVLDALMLLAADTRSRTAISRSTRSGRRSRCRARRVGGRRRARRRLRDERRRHVHAPGDPADRPPLGRAGRDRRAGHRLPRDRRPRAARAAAGDAGRKRAEHGALAPTAATLTEWETDLSSQTGATQAGILLGSNEDIPAFRWVEKETATLDDVLGAARLRRDRASPRDRPRAARETAARAAATCSRARPTT